MTIYLTDILLTGVSTLFLAQVLSFFFTSLRKKQKNYTKSTDNFSLKVQGTGIIAIWLATAFLAFCGYASSQDPEEYYMAYYFYPFAILSLLVGFWMMNTITVSGDTFKTSSVLRKKTYKFSDIAYVVKNMGVISAYDRNNNHIFTYDSDCLGASNMTKRLKEEGITFTDKKATNASNVIASAKTLNKKDMATKDESLSAVIIGCGVMFGLIAVISLFINPEISFYSIAIYIACVLVIFFIKICPSQMRIRRIEKS